MDVSLRGGAIHARIRPGVHGRRAASSDEQYSRWANWAVSHICHVSGPRTEERTELDHLYRFLTEVADPNVPLFLLLETFSRKGTLGFVGESPWFPPPEVRRFCERLERVGQPLNVAYGRYGLLALRLFGGQGPVDPQVHHEVEQLARLVKALPPAAASKFQRYVVRLREVIRRISQSRGKRHPLPPNPIVDVPESVRVTFEPLDRLYGGQWLHWIKCDESRDIVWSLKTVGVMDQPGSLRGVLQMPRKPARVGESDQIYNAQWDGENIWVACRFSGVRVLSPSGEVVATADKEHGLPPYDSDRLSGYPTSVLPPLFLHPVERRKCLAVGKYGKNRRLWFALLAWDQRSAETGRIAVDVFHTAKNVTTNLSGGDIDVNARGVAEIKWTFEYPFGNRRLLLLGHGINGVTHQPTKTTIWPRPLAVDLDSLEVFTSSCLIPYSSSYAWSQIAVEGQILRATPYGVELLTPSGVDASRPWQRRVLHSYHDGATARLLADQGHVTGATAQLLWHEGCPVWPKSWIRITPQDWHVEALVNGPVPLAWRFQRCGESAHHGLVVWNVGDDRPYRVRIDIQPGPSDLEGAFPFVPKHRRTAHAHSVRKLRALGAKVDTWWHHCRYRQRPTRDAQGRRDWTSFRRPYWRTVVYLPRQWQGGDDGLVHLQDLYHLRDLYLVQCDVTDRGLQHVRELSGLEVLFLVETRATDAGLVHFQELKELVASHAAKVAKDCGIDGIVDRPNSFLCGSSRSRMLGLCCQDPVDDTLMQHVLHSASLQDGTSWRFKELVWERPWCLRGCFQTATRCQSHRMHGDPVTMYCPLWQMLGVPFLSRQPGRKGFGPAGCCNG